MGRHPEAHDPSRQAVLEQRPDALAVPTDERHEFLKTWLPVGDPVLVSWETGFTSRGVRYARREVNGRVMLYTHRFQLGRNASARWCCRPPKR